MLQVTMGMIGAASRLVGASVAGARLLPVDASTGRMSPVDSVLAAADRVLNDGSSVGSSAALSSIRQGVNSIAGTLGIQHDSDPVALTASDRTRLAVLQASEATIDQRIAEAQQQAAAGDPAARQRLASLQVKKSQAHLAVLGTQASSSAQFVVRVQDELTRQFTQSAGWESYLAPGGSDPLADARSATSPAERAAVNDRIMVALGVGVAHLDQLRAEIQYYEYLGATGQLTPDQQARLDGLRQQYAGSSLQLDVLDRARRQFESDNSIRLEQLRHEYVQAEQRVGRLVETQERLSGRALDGGAALDWDHATAAEKAAHLHAASDTVRDLDLRAVEHHDVSGFRTLQKWNIEHWMAFQAAMDRRAREHAEQMREDRREFDRRLRIRDDERQAQERLHAGHAMAVAETRRRRESAEMHEQLIAALARGQHRQQG